ncbi:MAG TPA: MmcQ/YjbR family DNA-binding protein [Bacteroidales bacterium]|nr:MmcQ/YjbR family DNA-binding protein [Bacteroidales bacterium]
MDIEAFRNYCLSKKGVTEGFPFDSDTLVFKVMGKIFALTDVESFESINLKCDPEKAVALRELYPEVKPGYHMNKTHWNTIIMCGSLPDSLLHEWTDHSYNLVVKKLPINLQKQLK